MRFFIDYVDGNKEICLDFSEYGNKGYFFRFNSEKTVSVCQPDSDDDLLE